ncbi:MAG TPA: CoA transferase [Acetobacteraceae bacterium]|nr:CoA transferase [Acetobacteraceae bacterium]
MPKDAHESREGAARSGKRPGPLAGLRVLDIATMIAAPLTASILGDYGADIVKIEMPGAGDTVRKLGAQRDGVGLYWKTLSRNKRSVAMDLRHPEAQRLFLRWLPQFDVLIENFRPGTLERWNLAPERLREIHPPLIILRMTGFGQDGPYRTRQGFGTLAEAMSGVASVLVRDMPGFPRSRPALTSFPLGDVTAGMMGVNGVLAALWNRERRGAGEIVDLAIYEALLKFMELEVLRYEGESEAETEAPRIPDSAPRGLYRCGDGHWMALSGSAQPVAERILRLIGGEALAADPRFRTNALRVAHVEELDAIISGWCAGRSREDCIAKMSAAGCAAGPLESVGTLVANPQVLARRAFVEVEDPELGPLRMTNVLPQFAGHARAEPRPGPGEVGADTLTVLAEDLGLGTDEIAHLQREGALGGPQAADAPERAHGHQAAEG